jgi:G3E family GTPase
MPVPTTIITGSLGVGKTTFIARLLQQRQGTERWAVVVNEFGALGLDGALLAQPAGTAGVTVKELPGGCMCCAISGVLPVALAQLLRTVKPQRLIIEPSGLGHPAGKQSM